MTAPIPFFDGHNDFLLRLMKMPTPREETWLGAGGRGHLDLTRMKDAGFASGRFTLSVPRASGGRPPGFKALLAKDLPDMVTRLEPAGCTTSNSCACSTGWRAGTAADACGARPRSRSDRRHRILQRNPNGTEHMTISLASCTARPSRADIDPLLTAFYEELAPRLAEVGYPNLDIPFWIEDFWHHVDEFLPPDGRIWIARDGSGRAIAWGTLRRIRPDAGEMKRLFVLPEARGRGIARSLVQARIDDARTMGWRHLMADSVRTNTEMQSLYLSFGFHFIDPYPESGTVRADPRAAENLKFMQLDL